MSSMPPSYFHASKINCHFLTIMFWLSAFSNKSRALIHSVTAPSNIHSSIFGRVTLTRFGTVWSSFSVICSVYFFFFVIFVLLVVVFVIVFFLFVFFFICFHFFVFFFNNVACNNSEQMLNKPLKKILTSNQFLMFSVLVSVFTLSINCRVKFNLVFVYCQRLEQHK